MMAYIEQNLSGPWSLILLGDGVVANVTLNKSGMKGAGSIQITFAWGLAVMIPAFIFGAASGAHFNPALTIALAVDEVFPGGWYPATSSHSLPVPSWAPAWYTPCLRTSSTPQSLRPQARRILHKPVSPQYGPQHLQRSHRDLRSRYLPSRGSHRFPDWQPDLTSSWYSGSSYPSVCPRRLTGAMPSTPAALGPRLAHAVLPIKGKGDSNWGYAPVVILGPVMGAVAAVLLYGVIPWA